MLNSYWVRCRSNCRRSGAKSAGAGSSIQRCNSPNDYCDKGKHQVINGDHYWVEGHAAVILLAHEDKSK